MDSENDEEDEKKFMKTEATLSDPFVDRLSAIPPRSINHKKLL